MIIHKRYQTSPITRLSPHRINFYFLLLALLFGGVAVGGAYRITSLKEQLNQFSQNTYISSRSIVAHRGDIYGSDRHVLAMNTDNYHVVVNPRLLAEQFSPQGVDNLVGKLADLLALPADKIKTKLSNTDRQFVYLKKNVPPNTAAKISAMPYRGVRTEYTSKRFYPNGEAVAHVLGFTDHQGVGRNGVEFVHHQKLIAQSGSAQFLRTAQGTRLAQLAFVPEVYGDDLHLTIDSRLQQAAYRVLQETVAKTGARAASAIVMDIQTGGLLALANYPSYNPNKIGRVNQDMQNIALSHRLEPGSTVKPFIVAAALQNNFVTAGEVLPTSKPLAVAKKTIREDRIKEDLTVGGVLSRSSNIGVVLLAQRMGDKNVWTTYKNFGFVGGAILGLPDEADGVLHNYQLWQGRDSANHSFGYGFSTTLIKLVRAYTALATDGYMIDPVIEKNRLTTARRVLSAPVARQVRLMLEETTLSGTGTRARIPGFRVAGKTGTVHKVVDGKYDTDKIRAFFVGMAPVQSPRYVAVVMVDEPTIKDRNGGAVAAPAFSEIMRRALLYGGIAPTGSAISSTISPAISGGDGGNIREGNEGGNSDV